MSEKVNPIYAITKEILSFFNLTDAGKVDSTISIILKGWRKGISDRQINIKTLNSIYESKLDDMNDNLADAQAQLNDAWLAINPEVVGSSRAEQKEFAGAFERNVDAYTAEVERLEENIKEFVSDHKAEIKVIESEIKELEYKISKLDSSNS